MTVVNVHQAKTQLSALLAKAERGEEVVIARDGKPIVRLQPVQAVREPRKPGLAKGEFWMADDFDAPLPDDILKGFCGEDRSAQQPF